MRTSTIIKSIPKFFFTSSVLLVTGLRAKKISYIFRSAIQILWSDGIYAVCRE